MSGTDRAITLDGSALTPGQVEAVAREGARVVLSPAAVAAMSASREVIGRHLADGEAHYGINTGFGGLSRERVGEADLATLQRNLVRSHAAGVGSPLGRDVVRGMTLLLAASLARGRSGVRPVVAERLVEMLNAGVTAVVPEVGSVGASGDLAPLAHVALALIGEGRTEGGRAVHPLALEAKEGLALINGTHLMAARGALLVCDAERLFRAALVATAMSIDACLGTDAFLDERVYAARNQPGATAVAARLRELLAGSQIIPSHREHDPRVQDPYSLRCAPVVLGAAGDALGYVKLAVERELGAVTDNPLVFGGEPAIVSAGNFHGMPVAIPLDVLAIAVAHIAGISERRTFYLLAASDSENPIPAYLSPSPGLHSGLMIAQYTAAACCNEIVGLAAPASVVNLPTSAGMEDYNSFGPRSAAKAARAVDLANRVVAVELCCAAEAIEYHRPLKSGEGVERAHAALRKSVPRLTADRPLSADIETVAGMIAGGAF
jgi:histidine ammonia-lyase